MARRAMVCRGTTRTGRSKESAASNQSENVRKRKSDEVADDGETATSALSRNPNQAEHTANEDVSTGGRTRKRTNMSGSTMTSREAVGAEERLADVDSDNEEEEEENVDNGGVLLGEKPVDNQCVQRRVNSELLETAVPATVLARKASGSTSGVSSRLTGSVHGSLTTGEGSVITMGSSGVSTSGASDVTSAQKFGGVKAAVRKTVFRYIKFLGKSGSKELEWDKKIAALVYSHLNMTNWTPASKKGMVGG